MSKAVNPITEVIFRKYPKKEGGQIIALFPYVCERRFGTCESYMHVGQHGTADYQGVMQTTKAAKPSEYADLKAELENYGPPEAHYNLKVITKLQWRRYQTEYDNQIRNR